MLFALIKFCFWVAKSSRILRISSSSLRTSCSLALSFCSFTKQVIELTFNASNFRRTSEILDRQSFHSINIHKFFYLCNSLNGVKYLLYLGGKPGNLYCTKLINVNHRAKCTQGLKNSCSIS